MDDERQFPSTYGAPPWRTWTGTCPSTRLPSRPEKSFSAERRKCSFMHVRIKIAIFFLALLDPLLHECRKIDLAQVSAPILSHTHTHTEKAFRSARTESSDFCSPAEQSHLEGSCDSPSSSAVSSGHPQHFGKVRWQLIATSKSCHVHFGCM